MTPTPAERSALHQFLPLTWGLPANPKCQEKHSGEIRTGKQETHKLRSVLKPHVGVKGGGEAWDTPGAHLKHT